MHRQEKFTVPQYLKRIGIIFVSFVGLIALAVTYTQVSAEVRLRKRYDVQVEPIIVPTSDAAIKRGRDLVVIGRCTECHGLNLGGQVTADDPIVGAIYATNLTTGAGGVGQIYSNVDWVRAIRHGIGKDGRSLVITPAQYYYYLSDLDLGAIIAYVKSVPPVDNELPAPSVGPLGRLFLALFGPKDWLPAEKIDHTGPRPVAPEPGVTADYGKYLVRTRTCMVCHNPSDISGAPGGDLMDWTEQEFIIKMRFSSERSMSVSLRRMPDEDLMAMWKYLRALPVDTAENP